MKNKTIFASQNQSLINLFQDAGHPDKVLCIPIDYAKQTHTALCCNGSGKILKKSFPVKNTPEGIAFLLDAVDQICRKHHIKREYAFILFQTSIWGASTQFVPFTKNSRFKRLLLFLSKQSF